MSFRDFMRAFSNMSEERIEDYSKENEKTISKIDRAIARIKKKKESEKK